MPLPRRQPFRNVHLNPHIKVAPSASAKAWQSLSAQSEHRIRLGAGGHVDRNLTIERRHVDAGAEHGVDDLDRFDPVEIATMSLEARIVSRADNDEEIAGRQPGPSAGIRGPARAAPCPLPRQREYAPSVFPRGETLPLPLHSGQGVSMMLPRPPHSGQVVICCRLTPPLRWLRTSWPLPSHLGQVRGFVPALAPDP